MSGQIIGQVLLWLILAIVAVFVLYWVMNWLYRRSTKEIAFVRTGFLGEKVVIDKGAFVFPIINDITPVNMNSMDLPISREKSEALITKDHMRLDVKAEFYVRVEQSSEGVSLAASTLGRRTLQPDGIRNLLEGKFVSALRTVTAEMTLQEIHEGPSSFVERVQSLAQTGLSKNGLELETVALIDVDQTEIEYFNPSNQFDAEGLTTVVELTEARRKMRNDIEQETAVQIRERNLNAERQTLDIERQSEEARLSQEQEVEFLRAQQRASLAKERANRETEAEQARIDSEQSVQEMEIARQRKIDEAEISKNKTIDAQKIKVEQDLDAQKLERRKVLEQLEVARVQALREAEIASQEEIERAQIASDRGLDEARLELQTHRQKLEIEKERAVEEAAMEKAIAIYQKSLEESAASIIADVEKAKAAQAAERVKTTSEMESVQRQRDVDIELARKKAEETRIASEAEQVRAAVEAEGRRLINEAENILSDESRSSLFKQKLLEHVEGIIAASVKPLENIKDIRIVELGGASGSTGKYKNSSDGGAFESVSPTDEVINSALRYRVQAPMVDSLLSDIGIDGSNISKSGGLLREAADLSRIENEQRKSKRESDAGPENRSGEESNTDSAKTSGQNTENKQESGDNQEN